MNKLVQVNTHFLYVEIEVLLVGIRGMPPFCGVKFSNL